MQTAAAAEGGSSTEKAGQKKGLMGRFKNYFSGKSAPQENIEGKNASVNTTTAKTGNENMKSPGEEVKL